MTLPEIVMVPLDKIKDNPWRDKKRNPIDPERVAALKESIEATGEFWVGCYGRKVAGGFVELAFGHNRKEAAEQVGMGEAIAAAKSAGLKSIPVALRDFTDGEMLMRMVRENLRGDLPVVLEAVSAAVRALAEGKISIPAPERTNPDKLRYAPSYVPGRKPTSTSEVGVPYTATTLAKFLGGIYIKQSKDRIDPQNSVIAALGILELEELKIEGFTARVYEGKSIREIIPMNSDIKQRHIVQVERRGKSAEEIAKLRREQLETAAKVKAEEKRAEEDHKALVKQRADALREENIRKADALAKQIKENDKRAQEKEVLNKLRMAEFETQLKAKKEWEAQQQVQDDYLPIRRDVEAMIGKMERIVTESNPFREDVKSLSMRKGIKPEDKLRLRKAAVAVADWYADWVAPQFAPELKAAQKVAAIKRQTTETRPKGKGGA